jgi:hypothetical protein
MIMPRGYAFSSVGDASVISQATPMPINISTAATRKGAPGSGSIRAAKEPAKMPGPTIVASLRAELLVPCN